MKERRAAINRQQFRSIKESGETVAQAQAQFQAAQREWLLKCQSALEAVGAKGNNVILRIEPNAVVFRAMTAEELERAKPPAGAP